MVSLHLCPHHSSLSTYSALHRSQNFDTEADWNITTEPNPGANNRQVKVSRGKFLGGSSGVNGTICIRGTKQDYDDWDMSGWSGEEVFGYMKKVRTLCLDISNCVETIHFDGSKPL